MPSEAKDYIAWQTLLEEKIDEEIRRYLQGETDKAELRDEIVRMVKLIVTAPEPSVEPSVNLSKMKISASPPTVVGGRARYSP